MNRLTDTKALVELTWPPQGQWTFADYLQLPYDGWQYEIIEGELYTNPAPRPKHQEAVSNLLRIAGTFVHTHQVGKVYTAPVNVILPDEAATPVQPDLLFIAANRSEIVQEERIEGAPDWVVEVLSPSNWLVDRRTKFDIYARSGVREYWIVDVDTCTIEVFVLQGHRYTQVGKFGPGEQVTATVLKGFKIAVDQVCPVQK